MKKFKCEFCGKSVSVNFNGKIRRHGNGHGTPSCKASGMTRAEMAKEVRDLAPGEVVAAKAGDVSVDMIVCLNGKYYEVVMTRADAAAVLDLLSNRSNGSIRIGRKLGVIA